MNIDDLNNNILSNRWKERYEKLSDEIKEKLNELDNSNISDYQLQVIKRKRLYPEIGDIFKVNPRDNIYFYGVVLNNHIHNINGDDLLLVLIFKQNIDIKGSIINGVKEDDLLLPPQIIGKEYWTRGFFYNVEHYDEILNVKNYGFYSIGKGEFVDEYGKELANQPKLLGTYGVAAISGIARKINQELIIRKII